MHIVHILNHLATTGYSSSLPLTCYAYVFNFVISRTALCLHDYDSIKLQLSSDLHNTERGLRGLFTSKDAICSSKKKKKYIYIYANYQGRNEIRKHGIVADLLSKTSKVLSVQ